MGLRTNSFFANLASFSETQFLQQENLPVAALRVDGGGLNKVKCVKGRAPVTTEQVFNKSV